jgi:ACS family hexuronate transporter-like MFS transporter
MANSSTGSVGNYRWRICALLFFATTINYLDRQVLSLLKPTLEDNFGWTNQQYANIASVFQFTYAISLLLAGRFIDKLGTKSGFTWAIIIWSLGAMVHALAIPMGELLLPVFGVVGVVAVPVSVLGFMIARFILAVGEAGNFPAAIKATAEYFPQRERSLATGIFNSGANIGAILAPLSVPWIAEVWGWQMAFIIIGAIGFLWLIFWQRMYTHPSLQKALSAAERTYILGSTSESENPDKQSGAPWLILLKYRATWAFALGKFFTDGVWWFYLFWLPAYLKDQYGLTGIAIMLPLTILYSITMFGSIGGGYLPTLLSSTKRSIYQSRLRAMGGIALLPLVVLLAQPYGSLSVWVPVLLIGIGAAAHQAWSANLFTTVSDMFPQKAVASVVGIGGMAGGIGSVVITQAGGHLFDHYKSLGSIETGYTIMFAFCAVAYLIAWSAIKVLVPVEKPIHL